MDELEFLQGVDLCQGLTPRELGLVRNYCREGSCREHDILHKEGDPARDMCFLISGQVDLRYRLPGKETSKETTVSSILPGRTFGWSALVPPHQLTLTAQCAKHPCSFLMIRGQDLMELFESEPRIGYVMMRNLSRIIGERFRALQEEVARQAGYNLMHGW